MVDQTATAAPLRTRIFAEREGGLWLTMLLATAVLGVSLVRLWLASVQPLWFDESWTAMVAAAPWRELPHLFRVDPNPPLYYLAIRVWAQIAGVSDLALRLPGLAAVALAAFLPSLMKTGALARPERLAWGWLMFAWWGVDQFLMARGFPVLLALSTAQLIVYLRLLARPDARGAWVWAAISAATVMIHYYAAPVAAVQGAVFLAMHRRAALRCWPAALAFAPAAAWMAYHAAFLARFADAAMAWHPRLEFQGVIGMAVFPLHHTAPLIALAALVLIAAGLVVLRKAAPQPDSLLWIAAAASWAALLIVIASAAWRPTLIARYLTPAVPGVLLSLVLLARRSAWPRATLAGVCALYALGLAPAFAMIRGPDDPSPYGHERASQILMRHGVTDVVFLWDHETAEIQDRAAMAAVGRFYFDRAGARVKVVAPQWRRGEDLNRVAVAAARGARPGIIWIYNRNTQTAAKDHPPAIDRIDERFVCEDIGYEGLGSVACYSRL